VDRLTDLRGLALVLSGGGARAAYQVGVLRVLAREFPQVVPDILTGVSAGGINAAFLAARQAPFDQKVEQLAQMWSDLRIDHVFVSRELLLAGVAADAFVDDIVGIDDDLDSRRDAVVPDHAMVFAQISWP